MNDPNNPIYRLYNGILQGSILIFSAALVYFAFVYYPQTIRQYQTGNLPQSKPFAAPAAANVGSFPIETESFRITYEAGKESYFVFVSGQTLDQYLKNQNGAQLALKSALSANSLCSYNVAYISSANLEIPERYKDSGCR